MAATLRSEFAKILKKAIGIIFYWVNNTFACDALVAPAIPYLHTLELWTLFFFLKRLFGICFD
jgi:hypothetical protein